ncbi:TPA: hypothetical protein ACRN0V_006209, partial [Pseudomonas aeruginosa]
MDDKRAGRLADFLANLHDNGRKKIQGKQALAKYQGLMQSPAPNRHCAINYTRDNKASLRDHLFRFFKEPAGNTSVVLVHVDDKRDWVRFIRFVSKGEETLMPRLFLLQVRVWKVLMVLDIDMNT